VGYVDGGQKFGWIFGPRFEIGPDQRSGWIGRLFEIGPDPKPKFSHTTVQRSVQASLVVPGWTRSLKINYKTFWIDTDGNSRLVESGAFSVKLPGDYAAITQKLLAPSGERRIPFIEPPLGINGQQRVVRLQAGKPGDILIRGRHLWRNPKVFIGGQSAKTVTVLPDMNGLSAHFDSITIPANKSQENFDLSVVTSEGIATLPGAVEIFTDMNRSQPANNPK
jgi:hypothetical protein